jgi:predicted nucleic acid-binding protein
MRAIVDTGPLVAFLDRRERAHRWAADRFAELEPPAMVCEPVLTEAAHLLGPYVGAREQLLGALTSRALAIGLRIDEHLEPLRLLLGKYRDQPMSLADACVVRMAELYENHAVVTLDSDFAVYRRHGRMPIRLVHPDLA